MDRHITAAVDAPASTTMAALADLGTYPHWLALVQAADPIDDATWNITLRARLGPLARSKRLRMARTDLDAGRVRFERVEVDGRDHAEWALEAKVTPNNGDAGDAADPTGCEVDVHLHYGGALWSTPLELALASVEDSAAERLTAYLSAPTTDSPVADG